MVRRRMPGSAARAGVAAAEAAAVDAGAAVVVAASAAARTAAATAGLGEGAALHPAGLLLAAVVVGAVHGRDGLAVLLGDDLVALGGAVAVTVDAALVGVVRGTGGEGGGE